MIEEESCRYCKHWNYVSGVSGTCSYLSHYHDDVLNLMTVIREFEAELQEADKEDSIKLALIVNQSKKLEQNEQQLQQAKDENRTLQAKNSLLSGANDTLERRYRELADGEVVVELAEKAHHHGGVSVIDNQAVNCTLIFRGGEVKADKDYKIFVIKQQENQDERK